MEFLYEDGHYHFMNTETYDQIALDREALSDAVNYLTPNARSQIDFFDTTPIGVSLPKTVDLKIVETAPELKSATVTNALKPATLETGLVVQVPNFVSEGDVIRVDTETGRTCRAPRASRVLGASVSPWWCFGVAVLALAAREVGADVTKLVSVDSSGVQANADSFAPALSADGRFVAFYSNATTLVPGDTRLFSDVFVRDRATGSTERVSPDSPGGERTAIGSPAPAISADGRFVVFTSSDSDVVQGDTNGTADVFVRDRETDVTERVSVDSAGAQANGDCGRAPAVSADGRFVAFLSAATNLVTADTNGAYDIFVHDRQTGVTERVSVDSSGAEANGNSGLDLAISGDGRFVVFDSVATNLVPDDTNGVADVFVHDRQTGVTERVSLSSAGAQANDQSSTPAISADGRFVVFASLASNLVAGDTNGLSDVFVHDRQAGLTERVSVDSTGGQATGFSGQYGPSISADGRFVAFTSSAKNLVPGATNGFFQDVYVHDRQTGVTQRVSLNSLAAQGDADSFQPALSADGRVVAFVSAAHNLVPGGSNGFADVFVRYPCTGTTCVLEDTRAARACAGQALPESVTNNLDRAVDRLDQIGNSSPRRAHKLLRRVRRAFTTAGGAATRAARGRRPHISPDCATALRQATAQLVSGRRAR